VKRDRNSDRHVGNSRRKSHSITGNSQLLTGRCEGVSVALSKSPLSRPFGADEASKMYGRVPLVPLPCYWLATRLPPSHTTTANTRGQAAQAGAPATAKVFAPATTGLAAAQAPSARGPTGARRLRRRRRRQPRVLAAVPRRQCRRRPHGARPRRRPACRHPSRGPHPPRAAAAGRIGLGEVA
jgi:hypothetical protein